MIFVICVCDKVGVTKFGLCNSYPYPRSLYHSRQCGIVLEPHSILKAIGLRFILTALLQPSLPPAAMSNSPERRASLIFMRRPVCGSVMASVTTSRPGTSRDVKRSSISVCTPRSCLGRNTSITSQPVDTSVAIRRDEPNIQ